MEVVRALACLQLDPLSVVARSHLLVLFSRLGSYDPAELDRLLWDERRLFEYWAHCASIVLTEDYPLHSTLMRRYPRRDVASGARIRAWVSQNERLRRYILNKLRRHGPLLSRELEEHGRPPTQWVSTGWTSDRNVSRMLDYLWLSGKIMVASRQGIQKAWDLAERCLPAWTPRERLSEHETARRAAIRALRALGVGTARQVQLHFMRWRFPDLERVLTELEAEGQIQRAVIRDDGQAWPGEWFVHTADVPLLQQLAEGAWEPRTSLLSPFDNLICDRQRTAQLFSFDYRVEIYTPRAKRRYGYYVMPILYGDRFIGRLDPELDRDRQQLTLHAVYAEADAPRTRQAAVAVARAVEDLAAFLGARKIVYNTGKVPSAWKRDLLA
jgi:uncharacterized protein YcaQ